MMMRLNPLLLLGLLIVPSAGERLLPPARFSSVRGPAISGNQPGLPMSFEVNRGQAQPGIDFVAHGRGYTSYLKKGRATLHLNRPGPLNMKADVPADAEISSEPTPEASTRR